MCQYSVSRRDGQAEFWHQMHYGSLATGGAGMVLLEATAVAPEGRITPYDLGLWDDSQIAGLSDIVDFAHAQGVAAGVQIAHAGRKGSASPMFDNSRPLSIEQGGYQIYGPSALAYGSYPAPRAMTVDQIEATVQAFAQTAARAVQAGFDLIEIHAAHGYLLSQFFSPLANHRADQYGGSLEARSRLILEVLRAVRLEVPASKVLAMRISATEWVPGGNELEQSTQLAAWAAAAGLDLLDVSSGGVIEGVKPPAEPCYLAPLASHIKAETGLVVNTVGIIDTSERAEQLVASGAVDAIMLGRPLLRNPHLPIQWANELGVDLDQVCPPPYSVARWRESRSG